MKSKTELHDAARADFVLIMFFFSSSSALFFVFIKERNV